MSYRDLKQTGRKPSQQRRGRRSTSRLLVACTAPPGCCGGAGLHQRSKTVVRKHCNTAPQHFSIRNWWQHSATQCIGNQNRRARQESGCRSTNCTAPPSDKFVPTRASQPVEPLHHITLLPPRVLSAQPPSLLMCSCRHRLASET